MPGRVKGGPQGGRPAGRSAGLAGAGRHPHVRRLAHLGALEEGAEDDWDIVEAGRILDGTTTASRRSRTGSRVHGGAQALAELRAHLSLRRPARRRQDEPRKSIARAMGRKFIRMSLGGIRDEARSVATGAPTLALWPALLQNMKTAAETDPCSCSTRSTRSARTSAATELGAPRVLDPEQNSTFSDHYLGSVRPLAVIFITTANVEDTIIAAPRPDGDHPAPRLHEDEKMHIATASSAAAAEQHGLGNGHLSSRRGAQGHGPGLHQGGRRPEPRA